MTFKAYRITEYDWYAARDAQEAINTAIIETGDVDVVDDMFYTGEPAPDDMLIWDDEEKTKKIKVVDYLASFTEACWCFGIVDYICLKSK